MTRIITDEQAKYAHEHSQLVSGPEMRANLSAEWDAYIAHVRFEAWEEGRKIGWGEGFSDAVNPQRVQASPNPYAPDARK